ncbi:MAG: outer membrane lipoprotein-sorting protein [Candidatus Aminicenantes bacterium]|nr:outer membrane lipoprotein-sorting protein [Candidatus Aminicenantes bacterium]NIN92330.1 outer membrane lipoprotein-sorting protein [bacterium]
MKKISIFTLILVLSISGQAVAQELTAVDVLKKVDVVLNAAKDQDLKMKIVLIDKNGKEKDREAVMLQKGSEKRMIKFLSPADQKGIAFLDLPNDIMYLYLPAFKKVRRIAAHIKNQKFAGTDMTYDDLGTINYSEEYDPVFVEKNEQHFVLELTPKQGIKKDYSKLKIWVLKNNFFLEKMEFFDKGGNLWKKGEWREIEKNNNYWVAREIEFHDIKDDHRTKVILLEVKFDTGLKDEFFTPRYLKR